MIDTDIIISSDNNTFKSTIFENNLRIIKPPDTIETIFDSSNIASEQLSSALKGIKLIAVLGWSSQGPAHAQNIRDSIAKANLDIKVIIGLRDSSSSRQAAVEAEFTVVSNEEAAKSADIVSMLISDSGQVDDGERYIDLMKPGSTLLFAHGFYLGWREQAGLPALRNDINIIGVCPKGMGPSVRKAYQIGSGINSSFAVEQNNSGNALDTALAYSAMIGSPYTFLTTLGSEWRSDIFGERAVLLGGVHGTIEGLASEVMKANGSDEQATYLEVVQSMMGPITDTILDSGFRGLVDKLSDDDKQQFMDAYNAAYDGYKSVVDDIYENVSSGREIASVVNENKQNKPFENISDGPLWSNTIELRESQRASGYPYNTINPVAAGMYIACMVAQIDKLREMGHHWSEVINESVIEAVASLNPYIKSGGVDYMVDNCSITARRGDRAWFKKFEAATEKAHRNLESYNNSTKYEEFTNHKVHAALEQFAKYRPVDAEGSPVNIAIEVLPEALKKWRATKNS